MCKVSLVYVYDNESHMLHAMHTFSDRYHISGVHAVVTLLVMYLNPVDLGQATLSVMYQNPGSHEQWKYPLKFDSESLPLGHRQK